MIKSDTCSLVRMYEWESIYAVNIKDALSYLWKLGKLWEAEINVQEFTNQAIAIKESIYEQKHVRRISNSLKKRPVPWVKMDGTMGRREEKGFIKQFKQEIKYMVGKR